MTVVYSLEKFARDHRNTEHDWEDHWKYTFLSVWKELNHRENYVGKKHGVNSVMTMCQGICISPENCSKVFKNTEAHWRNITVRSQQFPSIVQHGKCFWGIVLSSKIQGLIFKVNNLYTVHNFEMITAEVKSYDDDKWMYNFSTMKKFCISSNCNRY